MSSRPEDLFNRSGIIRSGFDLSVYTDREPSGLGGTHHGWGGLDHSGVGNALVDMVMVTAPWGQTHVAPSLADFSVVNRRIDDLVAANKRVYLYPHVAFPPAWADVAVVNPEFGWIDYFDPEAHERQCEWLSLLARHFGKDERVTAIRMASFEHGEAWVTGVPMQTLREGARRQDVTLAEAAEPFLWRIYETFLEHADPHRLVAHGGGLQGSCVRRAVEAGCGHGNGTLLLDFAGQNHYPLNGELGDGHFRLPSLREVGNGGHYFAERQCGEAWIMRGDAFVQWLIFNFATAVAQKVSYLMLPEALLNGRDSERLPQHDAAVIRGADEPLVSPDTTGRLTRRNDEDISGWRHEPWHTEAVWWLRSLLGTSEHDTPEAFVQLSSHHLAETETDVGAIEHAATLDLEIPMVPVKEFDAGAGAEFQRELFGHRKSHFAKRTDKQQGGDRFRVRLDPRFTKSLVGLGGELVEVRVTYEDAGYDSFSVSYPRRHHGPEAVAGRVRLTNPGLWRTACFLLVDPQLSSDGSMQIDIVSEGSGDLTVALIRVLKQS